MNIRKASADDIKIVYNIVHETIDTIYPHYYPDGAVSFMKHYHRTEIIQKEIMEENVYLLKDCGTFAATGTVEKNGIKRLFVLPKYQGKGYGTQMMDFLEKLVSKKYASAIIDSSLPAYNMYLKRGYYSLHYQTVMLNNNDVLCYHEMEKIFQSAENSENYNNRLFRTIQNSGNGQVSETTVFHYHQNDDIVWADYHGGEIRAGVLVRTLDENGALDFRYRHYNLNNEMRAGVCHSVPERTKHGRLRLRESWEWTEGASGKGTSMIEEME